MQSLLKSLMAVGTMKVINESDAVLHACCQTLTSWTFPPRLGSGCHRWFLFSSWSCLLVWWHMDRWSLSYPWPGDPAHWQLTRQKHTQTDRGWTLHKKNKHLLLITIFVFSIHTHLKTQDITHTVMQSLVTLYWLTGRCWVMAFLNILL